MNLALRALLGFFLCCSFAAGAAEPVAGTDYSEIGSIATLSPAPGKIEVVEVFAYYCAHCARAQPLVDAWKDSLAADVDFKYAPTVHGSAEPVARGFFASRAMGVLERVHRDVFQAIVVDRRLGGGAEDDVVSIYEALGLDGAALRSTMYSFAVNAEILRTKSAIERWQIEHTPTFVVNGRYLVVPNTTGHEGMLRTVDYLINLERRRLGKVVDTVPPSP